MGIKKTTTVIATAVLATVLPCMQPASAAGPVAASPWGYGVREIPCQEYGRESNPCIRCGSESGENADGEAGYTCAECMVEMTKEEMEQNARELAPLLGTYDEFENDPMFSAVSPESREEMQNGDIMVMADVVYIYVWLSDEIYTWYEVDGENVHETPNLRFSRYARFYRTEKRIPDVPYTGDFETVRGGTLSEIPLPGGFEWQEPSTELPETGTFTFPADYTPANGLMYETVTGVGITVTVRNPVADMKYPNERYVVRYSPGLRTGDVPLPDGWTFERPDEPLDIGIRQYTACFEKDGSFDYVQSTDPVQVKIEMVRASVFIDDIYITVPAGTILTDDLLPSVDGGKLEWDAAQYVATGNTVRTCHYIPSDTYRYNTAKGITVHVSVIIPGDQETTTDGEDDVGAGFGMDSNETETEAVDDALQDADVSTDAERAGKDKLPDAEGDRTYTDYQGDMEASMNPCGITGACTEPDMECGKDSKGHITEAVEKSLPLTCGTVYKTVSTDAVRQQDFPVMTRETVPVAAMVPIRTSDPDLMRANVAKCINDETEDILDGPYTETESGCYEEIYDGETLEESMDGDLDASIIIEGYVPDDYETDGYEDMNSEIIIDQISGTNAPDSSVYGTSQNQTYVQGMSSATQGQTRPVQNTQTTGTVSATRQTGTPAGTAGGTMTGTVTVNANSGNTSSIIVKSGTTGGGTVSGTEKKDTKPQETENNIPEKKPVSVTVTTPAGGTSSGSDKMETVSFGNGVVHENDAMGNVGTAETESPDPSGTKNTVSIQDTPDSGNVIGIAPITSAVPGPRITDISENDNDAPYIIDDEDGNNNEGAEYADEQDEENEKKSSLPVIIAVTAALLLGAAAGAVLLIIRRRNNTE